MGKVETGSAYKFSILPPEENSPTLTVTADGNVRAHHPEDPGYNEELLQFATTSGVLRDVR